MTSRPKFPRAARIDRVGALTSAVCGVHCAIAPAILPILPMTVGRLVGPGLEFGFVTASITLGMLSLSRSVRTMPGNGMPLALFVVGIMILLLSQLLDPRWGFAYAGVVALGASCVVGAHIVSLRASKVRVNRLCLTGDP